MTVGRICPPPIVRATIAATILDGADRIPERIGSVSLRPHQRAAAARLVALIRANGGALLAEPVGLGKTYAAIAVAAQVGGEVLVVAPAALRDMWSRALDECAVVATIVSHESLSRGHRASIAADFIIVDEAHRVRSAATKRYALLASMSRRSRMLLVTATPVQNRRTDLAAQLALFLGRRAWELSDDELAAHVIRGADDETRARGVPRQVGPSIVGLATEDDCLEEIMTLPPPVPAKDESIAAALLVYGLVHQWTSSRAALASALRRRRTRGLALLTALESGRRPTRAELSAWTHFDDAMQLAFPELVTQSAATDSLDVEAFTIALDRHNAAIEALLYRLRRTPDPDVERAAALRHIRAAHPGERVIAFCHYTETVNALRAHLAHDAGIAALTAHGARVAGGRVSRDTVLAQFIPHAGANAPVRAAERIDVLLTTDLLSEGLNLQEASVVVHLDLPWNPARLDQRVGRVRRLGSRHEVVTVYSVAPPASAERLLRIEQRLRDKLRLAQHTIGVAGRILPSPLAAVERSPGIAEQSGVVHARLRAWAAETSPGESHGGEPEIAAVASEIEGFVAAIHDGREARLIAAFYGSGGDTGDSPELLARALELASGCAAVPRPEAAMQALERIERYLRTQRGSVAIDFSVAAAARSRRAALERVAQTMARTPRHRRSQIAPLADAARAVATAPLGEGAERVLEMLVRAELPDEAWLRSIAAFGEVNARPAADRERQPNEARIVAVILLQPPLL